MKWIFDCYRNAAQPDPPGSSTGAHTENEPITDVPALKNLPLVFLDDARSLAGSLARLPTSEQQKGHLPCLLAFLKAISSPQKHFTPSPPLRGRAREAGPGPASCHLLTHTERSQVQTILGMCRLERFIYLCIHIRGSFQVPEMWTHKNIKFLWLKMTRRMPSIKLRKIFMVNDRQRFIILL